MTTLNAAAADVLRPHEPHAVTDVTGFGLFGHAVEVAERSGVKLVLESERLPSPPGALLVAERGLVTGGDARNREFAARRAQFDGVASALVSLASTRRPPEAS